MRINNMKVFDYLIFLFGSIIIHGCNQSTKEIVFYPSQGTKNFIVKSMDDSILIYKVKIECDENELCWKFVKQQGNYYNMWNELVMSNKQKRDTLYGQNHSHRLWRVLIDSYEDSLFSSFICIPAPAREYLDIQIIYDKKYNIKFIRSWDIYRTYKPNSNL